MNNQCDGNQNTFQAFQTLPLNRIRAPGSQIQRSGCYCSAKCWLWRHGLKFWTFKRSFQMPQKKLLSASRIWTWFRIPPKLRTKCRPPGYLLLSNAHKVYTGWPPVFSLLTEVNPQYPASAFEDRKHVRRTHYVLKSWLATLPIVFNKIINAVYLKPFWPHFGASTPLTDPQRVQSFSWKWL